MQSRNIKYKIKYVNYGLANRFNNYEIEMHKKLLSPYYKDLHDEILYHEMQHSEKYLLKDFLLDLKGFKHKRKYWDFVLTTPSSWWQFLPIYKSKLKNKYYLDISVLFIWIVGLLLIYLFIKYYGK